MGVTAEISGEHPYITSAVAANTLKGSRPRPRGVKESPCDCAIRPEDAEPVFG
jgi:hypothetical protein